MGSSFGGGGGGGGWSLVETVVAAGSSGVLLGEGNILSGFNYAIQGIQIDSNIDATVANYIKLQFGTGVTPTYQTTNYTGIKFGGSASAPTVVTEDITNGALLVGEGNSVGGSAAGETWDFWAEINNPAAVDRHRVFSRAGFENGSGLPAYSNAWYWRTTSEIITGFKVLSAGVTFSGTFNLYKEANI